MPEPRGVITVNGNMERSLHTEEHTTALAAEVQNGLIKPNHSLVMKTIDTAKRVPSTLQHDSSADQELDSSSASTDRPIRLWHMYRAYIITHIKYLGRHRRHTAEKGL